MKKTFKSCYRKQMLLFLPCLPGWLPHGYVPYFVVDKVEWLYCSATCSVYRGDGRGRLSCNPKMIALLLICAYCVSVVTYRKIDERAHEDINPHLIIS